jgi:putative addiction module component
MTIRVQDLESEALQLPYEERARLAKALLLSLGHSAEENVELVWAEEAVQRFQEIKRGEVETIPSDEVFRETRERLSRSSR